MAKGLRGVLSGLAGLLVLGVVLSLLLPAILSARERSVRISCANNLKCVGFGIKMYAGDHENAYPDRLSKISRYLAHQSVLFCCPSSGNESGTFETVDEWTDYAYISGLNETNAPSEILMYCHPKNHEGKGANILFLDGHVEWFRSEGKTGGGEPSFEDMMRTAGERRKP